MLVLAETELSSRRLVLEPLQLRHSTALFAGLQDPALYRFIPRDPPDASGLAARFERIATRGPGDGSAVWLNWAMRKHQGDYCGQFEATAMPGGLVDIAYFVFSGEQGQGFATEAAALVIAALGRDPDLTRIGASLDTRNVASAALVETLGFQQVGTVEGADFFKGSASDEYRYELARQAGAD